MSDTISVNLNLDQGFLRRTCPNCRQDFKWLQSEGGQAAYPDAGMYYCPYCGLQADGWFTDAQLEYLQQEALGSANEMIRDSLRDLERAAKQSGGLIDVTITEPPGRSSSGPPMEPNDMVRVEPPCHPLEPLKVGEDWKQPLHCLICGRKFERGQEDDPVE